MVSIFCKFDSLLNIGMKPLFTIMLSFKIILLKLGFFVF